MSSPIVYDKAKYHFDSVKQSNLPEIHAYIHTGMYLGWIIENNFLDKEFLEDVGDDDIHKFKIREITAPQLFMIWDGALVDDMLNEEGNNFSKYYFDLQKGQYLNDYMDTVSKGLTSEFHVEDTWENYEIVRNFVTKRHHEWKNPPHPKKWWEFWR